LQRQGASCEEKDVIGRLEEEIEVLFEGEEKTSEGL